MRSFEENRSNVADWKVLLTDPFTEKLNRRLNHSQEAILKDESLLGDPAPEDPFFRFFDLDNLFLDEQNLIEIRKIICPEFTGESLCYREHSAWVNHNPRARIEFARPETIKERMRSWFEFMNSEFQPVTLRMAYGMAEFLDIHPYAEGNGRTARAAIGIRLVKNHLPPLTIQENDRPEYITTLANFSYYRTLLPFYRFFLRRLIEDAESIIIQDMKTQCDQDGTPHH